MRKAWSMVAPAEPGEKIKNVTDRGGDMWSRSKVGEWCIADDSEPPRTWSELIDMYGPVTAELPDAIVVTAEMAQAGIEADISMPDGYTGSDVLRLRVIAALRAGGYEVTE